MFYLRRNVVWDAAMISYHISASHGVTN